MCKKIGCQYPGGASFLSAHLCAMHAGEDLGLPKAGPDAIKIRHALAEELGVASLSRFDSRTALYESQRLNRGLPAVPTAEEVTAALARVQERGLPACETLVVAEKRTIRTTRGSGRYARRGSAIVSDYVFLCVACRVQGYPRAQPEQAADDAAKHVAGELPPSATRSLNAAQRH